MATITAAGSGSGLDIETIISQLVSLEKIPLTNQQAVTKKLNTQISDLGNLKSNLSALKTAAQALSSVDFLSATKASSSDSTAVSVAASGAATTGSYSVNVSSLASSKSVAYSLKATDPSQVVAGLQGQISIAGQSIDLGSSDVSLNTVVSKINNSSSASGVTASLIKQGDGSYSMVLMGSKTGAVDGNFAVTGLDDKLASTNQLKSLPSITTPASGKSITYSLTATDATASTGLSGVITIAGQSIDLGSDVSLDGLVAKINEKTALSGVSASLAQQSDGTYSMALQGSKTGAVDGDFAVSGLDGLSTSSVTTTAAKDAVYASAVAVTTPPQDAVYTLNGIALTSASNEISGVASGLTITLNKVGSSNLTVSSDADAITKKVQTFVDAYNKVITNVTSLKDTNGSFKGDGMMRSLMSGLYQSIYQPVSKTTTGSTLATKDAYAPLTALGISLGEGNKLTFDSTKFQTALKSDAASVAKVFADGPAAALTKTVTDFLDTSGLVGNRSDMLDQRLKTSKDKETRISDQVDAKAVKIRAQYTALDVALAKMKASLSSMQSMLGTSSN